jgi:hypothetical protein
VDPRDERESLRQHPKDVNLTPLSSVKFSWSDRITKKCRRETLRANSEAVDCHRNPIYYIDTIYENFCISVLTPRKRFIFIHRRRILQTQAESFSEPQLNILGEFIDANGLR